MGIFSWAYNYIFGPPPQKEEKQIEDTLIREFKDRKIIDIIKLHNDNVPWELSKIYHILNNAYNKHPNDVKPYLEKTLHEILTADEKNNINLPFVNTLRKMKEQNNKEEIERIENIEKKIIPSPVIQQSSGYDPFQRSFCAPPINPLYQESILMKHPILGYHPHYGQQWVEYKSLNDRYRTMEGYVQALFREGYIDSIPYERNVIRFVFDLSKISTCIISKDMHDFLKKILKCHAFTVKKISSCDNVVGQIKNHFYVDACVPNMCSLICRGKEIKKECCFEDDETSSSSSSSDSDDDEKKKSKQISDACPSIDKK